MDYTLLKTMLTNTIPWVRDSGLRVDALEERHVRLSVPHERHLNHVGIVYAGTHFMLMEVAGAALFFATYGLETFVPVNKRMEIRYTKPATDEICCDLRLSREQAAAMMEPVISRGRGDWILDMSVSNKQGQTVSAATCNYYLIPPPDKA